MIYRKHIQREYLAAQRRERFPHTSLPIWLDEAIPVIGLLATFGLAVFFVAMGWA